MNACNINDESTQTLEVITRIVPASDKRGGATIDLPEKANTKWATYRTRSGCAIKHKSGMYNPATGQTIKWTEMTTVVDKDEDSKNYYIVLGINENKERVLEDSYNEFIEFINVGAGIGGGFSNTQELRVMKYHEAINGPDGRPWKEDVKLIDMTWAMKKKSSGTFQGRVNVR
jgi:hypothetical protein